MGQLKQHGEEQQWAFLISLLQGGTSIAPEQDQFYIYIHIGGPQHCFEQREFPCYHVH